MKVETEYSRLRLMTRSSCSPQVCSGAPLKRSWLNGMRYSAVHPPGSTVVATSHTGSRELSSKTITLTSSRRTPAGFTSKPKAVRWSW